MSCGTHCCNLLDHLSWVLKEFPLCALCEPSYYNWVLTAVGPFVQWIDPQAVRIVRIDPSHSVHAAVQFLTTWSGIHPTWLSSIPSSLCWSSGWVAVNEILCWPFKRVPGFLAASCLPEQTESPLLFTTRCYMGTPPSSGALGWGTWLGFETAHLLAGTFAAEITLQDLSCSLWERARFFFPLHPSYQFQCGFSVNPWLLNFSSASLRLVTQVNCSVF